MSNSGKYTVFLWTALLTIAGCKKEHSFEKSGNTDIISNKQGFTTNRYKGLLLQSNPNSNWSGATCEWVVDGVLLSTNADLYFVSDTEGQHEVTLNLIKGQQVLSKTVTLTVRKEVSPYSVNLSKVFEYTPAPGQFVNTMPVYDIGEDEVLITKRAETALKNSGLVHLGGFGGYIVAGFDHTLLNTPGINVMKIEANAFSNWAEPGIIMVSYDGNMNGLPDDEWFEVQGSEHSSATTVRNYEITYYKPNENKLKTPSQQDPTMTDTTYIRWTDNQGESGFLSKNAFHSQPYYPLWKGASISFKGTRLTNKYVVDQSGTGSYYVSPAFDYGYADNWGNGDDRSSIALDRVWDANGQPVQLTGIDFVKVYTGVFAQAGWLGEISTEISTIRDLNLK